MTSSDMQDTPAGRRAARADGPRSSQPKRCTFTAAYKLAMIEKYDDLHASVDSHGCPPDLLRDQVRSPGCYASAPPETVRPENQMRVSEDRNYAVDSGRLHIRHNLRMTGT